MSSKYWMDENECAVPGRHVHYGQNVVLPIPEQLGPFVNELRAVNERLRTREEVAKAMIEDSEKEIERLRALIDKHNDECRECPVIEQK